MNRYSITSSDTRVKRSVTLILSPDPWNGFLPLKLVVSTTRVSPSQRPRDRPIHCCRPGGGAAAPSSGMIRASWIISDRIITWSAACTMW